MTKIYKLTLLVITVLLLSSCDLLNNPKPQSSINIDDLNNLKEYQSLLTGTAYNSLQNYAPQLTYLSDSQTDFVDWKLSFSNYQQIGSRSIASNNTAVRNIWNALYKSINGANILIANINEVENASQSQIDNILGQAYFIRALDYYYLVQYFAKPWGAVTDNAQLGVPIRTEPVFTTDDFKEINRSSVKEVYDHIISDLKKADDFKITNSSSAKATNDAINALRARIALIQERWQDAVTFSEKVIPNFTLSSDVTDYFRNELGPESIFEIKNTPTDNPGGGNHTISVVYNINERPGALITNAYKSVLKSIITDAQQAALEASSEQAIDTRVTELLVTDAESPLTIDEYTHSDKYEDGTNLADNIPIFRLSEMILTKAEALVHIDGINEESIDLLNQIRARAIQVKKQNG